MGESSQKPTMVRKACQLEMLPSLFSTLCCEVYMVLLFPHWIHCRDFSTWQDNGGSQRPWSALVSLRVTDSEGTLSTQGEASAELTCCNLGGTWGQT